MTTAVRSRRRPVVPSRREHGFVLVPVAAFLLLAMGLGFALLLLIDRQTRSAVEQRDLDATQVLAEGVKAATANVLALPESEAWWAGTGCHDVSGDLTTPAAVPASIEGRIAVEVQRRFRDDAATTTYARHGRRVAWKASVCPTTDAPGVTDVPYTDAVLQRTGSTGVRDGRRTLWIRARARLLAADSRTVRVRAVAEKVQRGATPFAPPATYTLAAGRFNADLGVQAQATFDALSTSSIVLDGAIGKVLGISNRQLIEDDVAKIGIRCGVLNGLEDLANLHVDPQALRLRLCLGGMFGGLDKIAQPAGLDALIGPSGLNLGLGRFVDLPSFEMAPPLAITAYRQEAATRLSATDARTTYYPAPLAGSSSPAAAPDCQIDWSTIDAQRVVYVEQVGDGEQYCAIPAGIDATAKAILVARGRIVVRGRLRTLLYLLNRNECDGAPDGGCTAAYRTAHRGPGGHPREVVRIEGNGYVRGAVWADGAYSEAGLYPATAANEATVGNEVTRVLGNLVQRADAIVDGQVCDVGGSTPLVGPLLTAVTSLLSGVANLVSGLVAGTVYTQILPAGETPVPGSTPPAKADQACYLLNQSLIRRQPPVELLDVVKAGGTVPIDAKVWVRKTTGLLSPAYDWRLATAQEIAGSGTTVPTSLTVPTAVLGQLGSLLGVEPTVVDLLNMVANVFANRTMVERDPAVIQQATVLIPHGLARVAGTFRASDPRADEPAGTTW